VFYLHKHCTVQVCLLSFFGDNTLVQISGFFFTLKECSREDEVTARMRFTDWSRSSRMASIHPLSANLPYKCDTGSVCQHKCLGQPYAVCRWLSHALAHTNLRQDRFIVYTRSTMSIHARYLDITCSYKPYQILSPLTEHLHPESVADGRSSPLTIQLEDWEI